MIRSRMGAGAVILALLGCASACAGGPPRETGQTGNGLVQAADDGPVRAGAVATYAPGDRPEVTGLQGELLDGTTFDPATVAGMVVVVNFWASWCAPCRAEAGELNAAATETAAMDVRFLGVNIRDSRDAARSFVEGREQYPSLYDPAGRVVLGFAAVSPNTIPATVILDREGRVAMVVRKAVTQRELVQMIRAVAQEGRGG